MNLKQTICFVVCVNYHDFLRITLPRNRRHFKSTIVITSEADRETIEFCQNEGVGLVITNAFYDDGALFNKWKALDRALQIYARGQVCLLDADIYLPKDIPEFNYQTGNLYVPRRRMVRDPAMSKTEFLENPSQFEYPMANEEFAGYCQIFNADDPVLGPFPWHQLDWKHAGGADSFLWMKWPAEKRIRPNFEVLHLGEDGVNWGGRVTPLLDGRILEGSEERAAQLRAMIAKRRGRPRTENRYQAERQ